MTIRIVTDSTSDLPAAVAAEYGITVVPCYINIGAQSYLDGIGLSRAEFYRCLPKYNPLPTTAAPGIGVFARAYEHLAAEGATGVISIHAYSRFSNLCDTARMAAEMVRDMPVTIVDSQQVSMALGLLAVTAARAARAGCSVPDILGLLREKIECTYLFAALDTLEFLRRSGRVSWLKAGLGSLLQVKPIVILNRGNLTIETVRTYRRSLDRLLDLLRSVGPLEELVLAHAGGLERLEGLRQEAQPLFPSGLDPLAVEVTPIIGTHIGPGAVGFLCLAKNQASLVA